MKRVRTEYVTALVAGVVSALALTVCLVARTTDAAFLVVGAGAVAWYCVMRARLLAKVTLHHDGCNTDATRGH